jgi:RHS repeat-associated protein
LTRLDGTVYEFEANGDLIRVANKVGQYLAMQRTFGLLTSVWEERMADKTIYFRYTRDGRELLRSVRDELDRHYYFAYDDMGRLTAVFDPTKVDGTHGRTSIQETIPDNNPQGLTYSINVQPTFSSIGLVEVYLGRITHPRPSDLTITLISPSGRQAILFNRAAVSGPALELDNALLENFAGENPFGLWRLVIVDSQAGETGTLNDFQIRFTQPTNAVRYTYRSAISPSTAPANALNEPVNLTAYRGRLGEKINFLVRGNAAAGGVWGTGIYTDDSRLASAAVHARVLRTGELAVVTVTILPGQNGGYAGSTQNGVTSSPYALPWGGSYTISRYIPEVTSTAGSEVITATAQDGERLYANTYDGQGRVVSQAGGVATSRPAAVFYQNVAGGGLQTTYRNRLGHDTVFVHDVNYRLLSVTDALGAKISFEYNSAGDRTALIDALQRRTLFTYDANGNLASVTDPSQSTTRFRYETGNLSTIEDALGRISEFKYDGANNLREVRDAALNRDTKTYNGLSQLTGSALADGGSMDYAYTSGMPTSAGHPGAVGSDCPSPCRGRTSYDNAGRVTQMADPQGYLTRMEYDIRDNLIKQTDPSGKVITSEYDARNRLVRKVDRLGNVTTFAYDNNNNLIRQTDALGQITIHEYDPEDRLVRSIDPAGNIRSFTYDALGRITGESDGLGNSARREYDAAGNEVALYDARGVRVKKTEYDSRDLPTSVQDAFGHTYTSTYDQVGRLTTSKDPLNRTSIFTYDVLDRIVQVTDPLGRIYRQEFFEDDVVKRIVAPRNVVTEFRYDPANRMTAVETSGFQLNTLRYNGSDALTRETSVSGKIWNYGYDSNGRLSTLSKSGAPSVLFRYDDNGNLDTVRTATSPTAIDRDYDKLNRMTSFTDAAGNRLGYSYDKAGNLFALTYPDGRTVTYGYDAANRLVSIRDWANRITQYTYDANGNLTGIAFPNGSRRRMTYDAAGQVTFRQDLDSQGGVIVAYRYSYDAAGQLTAELSSSAPPPYSTVPASMTYDNDNRLVTFNNQPVTFDRDGNMTVGPLGSASAAFSYDFNNNLIQAGNVSYAYDLEDRLVGFTVSGAATSLVNNPGAGFSQVLQKRAPNGAVTRYVWGVGLAYEETGNEIRIYHYDHRGSTVAFTGNTGTVTGRVSYGPFGEVGERTGNTDSLFLFGGLFGVITDPQGLNYMRFRWYSPQIKRFVNQDAHFGDITAPRTLNRFAYVGNNPITGIDPEGEFCWPCIGAAVGATVNVVTKAVADYADDGKINDPWQEYVGAAIGGAIEGAIVSACPTCGALAGGAGAAAEYLSTQGLKGEKVDPADLALTTALGAVSGLGGPGGGLTRLSNFRFATNGITTLVKRQAAHQLRQAAVTVLKTGLVSGLDKRFGVSATLKREGLARLQDVSRQVNNLLAGPIPTRVDVIGRPLIVESSRQEVNRSRKAVYGEYIHYQIWLDGLLLAGRPVPNNPNYVLTSF